MPSPLCQGGGALSRQRGAGNVKLRHDQNLTFLLALNLSMLR